MDGLPVSPGTGWVTSAPTTRVGPQSLRCSTPQGPRKVLVPPAWGARQEHREQLLHEYERHRKDRTTKATTGNMQLGIPQAGFPICLLKSLITPAPIPGVDLQRKAGEATLALIF